MTSGLSGRAIPIFDENADGRAGMNVLNKPSPDGNDDDGHDGRVFRLVEIDEA